MKKSAASWPPSSPVFSLEFLEFEEFFQNFDCSPVVLPAGKLEPVSAEIAKRQGAERLFLSHEVEEGGNAAPCDGIREPKVRWGVAEDVDVVRNESGAIQDERSEEH